MSDSQSTTSPAPANQKKQPRGLYLLFGAEAWERFSYYGMRAILVLYLCAAINNAEGHPGLGFDRADALKLYGIYTGLVYLTPLIGGFLADRVLGARKAVVIGGITMAFGELFMAFPQTLYLALALLILGNGFFKPNISNIVGGLYGDNDPRRDGGFTIFYMGINLGSFFAPLVCGTLAARYGYHAGFLAACVGMIVGQITFNMGFKHLGTAGYPPDMGPNVKPGTPFRKKDWFDIVAYVVGVFAIIGLSMLIGKTCFSSNPNACLPISVVLLVLAGIWRFQAFTAKLKASQIAVVEEEEVEAEPTNDEKMVLGFTVEEWQRIGAILILSCFVVFFWMGFEQAGGTMTLFAEQRTDRILSNGLEIPASWFQSVNPFVICAFAPLFSMMWYAWDNSKYKIATPYKMAIGLFFLSLGFVVMYTADCQVVTDASGKVIQGVGPQWLAMVYFLHTMGELCLSPVGLSMVTKLAPQRVMSVMMGVWFMASAVANYSAGTLESLLKSFNVNIWYFLICAPATAGVLLLILSPMIKKWMHGRG